MLYDVSTTLLCINSLLWFGIIIPLTADKALAVAHKPHLTMIPAIDSGATCEAPFGVLPYYIRIFLIIVICLVYGIGDDTAELKHRCLCGKRRHNIAHQLHSETPVPHLRVNTLGRLACAAVNNGYVINSSDDTVLTSIVTLFSYNRMFYYSHSPSIHPLQTEGRRVSAS